MSKFTKGEWKTTPINTVVNTKTGKQIATVTKGGKSLKEQQAIARLIAAAPDSHEACKDFVEGWAYFCKRIDWDKTFLDAKAIQFMNEVPGKIQQAFNKADGE